MVFWTEHDLLSDFQSGFRKKQSTKTGVVYLTDYILEHMDRQMITGAVFIDLKKAFDLVDHECLLFKLEHYGVRVTGLDSFKLRINDSQAASLRSSKDGRPLSINASS